MNAEEYLLKIPFWAKKRNTLADVSMFLAELGHPQQSLRIIHVAGTNGKGSVCANMTAELMRMGYRVGTFISPHLVNIRERLMLNGSPIDSASFQETFDNLEPIVTRMVERGYQPPSFFEYLFLMAMCYYRESSVDYLILETGLGGRLDTTNVIEKPELVVITSISMDHMQYLGNSIAEIASEKAGIIKPCCPVVYDDNQPEASAVIRAHIQAAGVAGCPVQMPADKEREGFRAPYQAMNAALAVRALSLLNLPGWDEEQAFANLEHVVWPGRMEEIRPGIWLDGAHNEGGAAAFVEAATQIAKQREKQIHLLFAVVSDKNYSQMIASICKGLDPKKVFVTQLEEGRTADNRLLEQEFGRYLQDGDVTSFSNSKHALSYALNQKTEENLLFVVGSLYLIGEIKAIMEGRNDKL